MSQLQLFFYKAICLCTISKESFKEFESIERTLEEITQEQQD